MTLIELLRSINLALWGGPLLCLLFFTGLYLTFILRGFQFRYLGAALQEAFMPVAKKNKAVGDISHYQSLMTSLAGAIGTGSIVGVATAISIGGLGSLFWMWVTALIGMATKYAESLLAVHYRQKDKRGQMSGGPMHYIEKGVGSPLLATLFALLGCIAAITTGNLVQVNAIVESANEVVSLPPLWAGLIVVVISGCVIVGGVKSIGQVASLLVPFMALFYIGSGLFVIALHWHHLPSVVSLIFTSAFTGQAATGAFIGSSFIVALQMGVARSIFTNEAGLGISSIAAAAAITDKPARQAMVTMTGALFSTLIVCTVTGLVLGVTQVQGMVDANGIALDGARLAIYAFSYGMPAGHLCIITGLILFAFTTILAWAYYGEKCCEYLFGEKSIIPWRLLYVAAIIPGALLDLQLIWQLADLANALMVLPNLVALMLLAPIVQRETELFALSEKMSKAHL